MAFERYVNYGRGKARRNQTIAALWPQGHISLNRHATREFQLKEYQAAILFFDADTRRIGLRFSHDCRDADAVKLIKRANDAYLYAKAFCEAYQLMPSHGSRYLLTYEPRDELYVIDLRHPLPIRPDRRRAHE